MQLVQIEQVTPGMVLGDSIFRADGRLLLAKGVALTSSYLATLAGMGWSSVYIEDADTADIPVPHTLAPAVRAAVSRNLSSTFDQIARRAPALHQLSLEVACDHIRSEQFARSVGSFAESDGLQALVRDVDTLLDQLAGRDVLTGLTSIKAHDAYTFQHSIDVAVLGLVLGRHAGWDQQRLRAFGIGCLLHDVGKVFVDPAVLNKPGQLTADERKLMQGHPALGYQFIKAVAPTLGHLAPQVAYQHHERQDGSGYPRGLRGTNTLGDHHPHTIHEFGALAAVADVYDAMVSDRPYRRGWSPDRVVRMIVSCAGTHHNRHAAGLLAAVVAPYPVCSAVRVLNGPYADFEGIVVTVDPDAMDRPRIRLLRDGSGQRVSPVEVNLSIDADIRICGTEDADAAHPTAGRSAAA